MANENIKNLIFVDCEGHGPAPTLNDAGARDHNSVNDAMGNLEAFERLLKTSP